MFKNTATKLYIENVRNKTQLTDYELELIRVAFSTGFNVGVYEKGQQWEQELALIMVSS